jgi:hypothetical protein
MSVDIVWDGTTYPFPSGQERGWGASVTALVQAIAATAMTQTPTLTAELDLGATYGIKSVWFRSRTANPAAAGAVRLARADTVSWRNQANGADLPLGPGSDNLLEFNAIDVVDVSTAQTLTSKTLTAPTINSSPSVAPAVQTFGAATGPATTTTEYLWPGFGTGAIGTAAVGVCPPFSGRVRGVAAICTTAPAANMTISVRKNGVSQFTAVMNSGVTYAENLTDTFTFVAGDKISVAAVLAGAAAGAVNLAATVSITQA